MRSIHWALLMGSTMLVSGGCKKTHTTGTGGGGGGAWLVGEGGLMDNVGDDGALLGEYDTGAHGDLAGITCRGAHTAFVVGAGGTFLRTFDGGETWDSVDLGTTRALTGVAAGAGTVFIVGDGVFEASYDSGDSWLPLPGNTTAGWRSVATDLDASAALLVRLDGSVWRWDAAKREIQQVAYLPGARAISLSYDGRHAAVAGEGGTLARSDNGGLTWSAIDTGTEAGLLAVRAVDSGDILAVGTGGTVVHVDGTGVEVTVPGTQTLRAVNIDTHGNAVAAGDAGEVLVSSDLGDSWTPSDEPLTGTVLGLDFVDAD